MAYDDIGIKLWEVQIDISYHGQEKLNQLQNPDLDVESIGGVKLMNGIINKVGDHFRNLDKNGIHLVVQGGRLIILGLNDR